MLLVEFSGHFHTFSRFLRWLVGEFLMHFLCIFKKCIHFLNNCIKSAQKVHIEFIRKCVKYVKIFWKQSNILPILPQVTPECSSNTNMKECSSNTGMLKQRHTPWRKTIQMSISNPLFTTASSEAILQAKLDAKDFSQVGIYYTWRRTR